MSVKELVVYRKSEELLYKIYPRLINYPKAEKFALCQTIKEHFFELLKYISLGNSVKSKRKTQIFPINQGINTVGFKIHATHRMKEIEV